MSKKEEIKYTPGDKSVYINFDAIADLPDEYEYVITEVLFDPKKLEDSFANVGSKNSPSWMPSPKLMYAIAEACGISGSDASETTPIIEEVDINPMLMKGIEDKPTYRRMTVGRSVSKRSSRLMEDGSLLWSSLCTSDYNVWERCLELWSKEELYTEGYTKPSQYPNKYENTYKRRSHFDSEMKFAHAKAETKAHLKTIRELAGLPTGFSTEDLASGKFVFARIRRSKALLKMETAARLQAMSRGLSGGSSLALFGSDESAYDGLPAPDEVEPVEVEAPKEESKIIFLFKEYLSSIKDKDLKESGEKTLEWLEGEENPEANESYYKKALANLKAIEDSIPEAFRIEHELYEEAGK